MSTLQCANAIITSNLTCGNVYLALNTVMIGNSTVNNSITSGAVSLSNSTVNTSINVGAILVGNSSVNTSANSSGLYVNGSQAHVPAGTVMFFAASSAPAGFIKANGAAINRTTYASLFTAISTTFGTGDGSTTFNVPDMRGYFPRGFDDSAGVDSGRVFGTTQQDALQGHSHRYYCDSGIGAGFTGVGGRYADGTGMNRSNANVLEPMNLTGYGTVNYTTETRAKNVALLACIKY